VVLRPLEFWPSELVPTSERTVTRVRPSASRAPRRVRIWITPFDAREP
jgi:hypothetical protein